MPVSSIRDSISVGEEVGFSSSKRSTSDRSPSTGSLRFTSNPAKESRRELEVRSES